MTTVKVYVLKDEKGNYVSSNSISYYKKIGKYKYTFSKFLVNGFYTYQNELDAKEVLKELKNKAKEIGFNIQFNISKIDLIQKIYEESKIIKGRYPFISIVIKKKESAIA